MTALGVQGGVNDIDLLLDEGARRYHVGERIKRAGSITLPRLSVWNYEPCRRHERPDPLCPWKECGGDLLIHQKIGVAWLYTVRQGLLADKTGLGKTLQILGLFALMREKGELEPHRSLVVCQASSVLQWVAEAQRFAPGLRFEAAVGSKKDRRQRYVQPWDVMAMSSNILINDLNLVSRLGITTLVFDDVDALRHLDTKTAQAAETLRPTVQRGVVINATPLQTTLGDLYANSLPVGGMRLFGSEVAFKTRYVREEPIEIFDERTGRKTTRVTATGYKNMPEFKAKISPLIIRRGYEHVTDADIPEIAPPSDVWLDLSRAQRQKYAELQRGVLTIMREQGTEVRSATAGAKFMYGEQVCSGLPSLGEPDGIGASSKLDWLMTRLAGDTYADQSVMTPAPGGDWSDEKVVVFSKFKGTVTALEARCARAGVGVAKVWGEMTATEKKTQQDRFWQDPTCRVLVGTSSIERSLNLQVSNLLVNMNMLLNPARMLQILGRVRRVGSRHRQVHVFNLLTTNTQEERYLAVLEQRQAVADHVLDDENGLFQALSPLQLLQLIRPGNY